MRKFDESPSREGRTLLAEDSHDGGVFDVCVAGGGLAGLCAAIASSESGARTVLLEASETLGGGLLRSAGLLNACDPKRQYDMGLQDSPEAHLQDLFRFGNRQNQPELAKALCYGANAAADWLEAHGVRFAPRLAAGFGSSVPRGHLPEGNEGGAAYVRALSRALAAASVKLFLRTAVADWSELDAARVRTLFCERRPVQGGTQTPAPLVRFELRTRSLVLCTGGFAGNRTWLGAAAPLLADAPAAAPLPSGRLLERAVDKGAQTVGESFVAAALCAEGASGRLTPARTLVAAFRNPARFLLVNAAGERFIREDAPAEALLLKLEAQPGGRGFLLSPMTAREAKAARAPVFAPALAGLEAKLGLPSGSLERTLERFAEGAARREDAFARSTKILRTVLAAAQAPGAGWAAAPVRAAVFATCGGLLPGPSHEVLDRRGRPMPRLFAAGDILGGIHGTTAVPGNLLASAAVFGIAAGRAAADVARRPERSEPPAGSLSG